MGRTRVEVRAATDLIPTSTPGGPLDQSLFKDDFAIRYAAGESKRETLDHATVTRRSTNADFEPRLLPGFWEA